MQRKVKRHHNGSRKAISPVIATIILVAVTLVISVAVGGYIFGLFGGYTSTAQVTVTSSSLVKGATAGINPTLSVDLVNSGTSSVSSTGGTLTIGGTTYTISVITPAPAIGATGLAVTIENDAAANGADEITSLGALANSQINVGQAYSGLIILSNGAQIPFSGVVR